MCLILFAFRSHPRYSLVIAANRDEFLDRPTRYASPWEDIPDIVGGRDQKGGGTWMGVSRKGRLAAVTNYREPGLEVPTASSRGLLVSDFLSSDVSSTEYLDRISDKASAYNGFNLLVWDRKDLAYYSNRSNVASTILTPGVHGISNELLDTPWPKVEMGKQAVQNMIDTDSLTSDGLLDLLQSSDTSPDDDLPETGVGLELERALSPMFIRTGGYGTRCSTVILIDNDSRISMVERSFDDDGAIANTVKFEIQPR